MAQKDQLITNIVDLGRLLRERRKELSMSQEEAADLCNVSTPFLSMLENGKASVRCDKVLSVLHTLGLEFIVVERGLRRAGIQLKETLTGTTGTK